MEGFSSAGGAAPVPVPAAAVGPGPAAAPAPTGDSHGTGDGHVRAGSGQRLLLRGGAQACLPAQSGASCALLVHGRDDVIPEMWML